MSNAPRPAALAHPLPRLVNPPRTHARILCSVRQDGRRAPRRPVPTHATSRREPFDARASGGACVRRGTPALDVLGGRGIPARAACIPPQPPGRGDRGRQGGGGRGTPARPQTCDAVASPRPAGEPPNPPPSPATHAPGRPVPWWRTRTAWWRCRRRRTPVGGREGGWIEARPSLPLVFIAPRPPLPTPSLTFLSTVTRAPPAVSAAKASRGEARSSTAATRGAAADGRRDAAPESREPAAATDLVPTDSTKARWFSLTADMVWF